MGVGAVRDAERVEALNSCSGVKGAAELADMQGTMRRRDGRAQALASPRPDIISLSRGRGCSSGVEHDLAKVGVEGSNPFARSIWPDAESRGSRGFLHVYGATLSASTGLPARGPSDRRTDTPRPQLREEHQDFRQPALVCSGLPDWACFARSFNNRDLCNAL